jgi:hypothetical protein
VLLDGSDLRSIAVNSWEWQRSALGFVMSERSEARLAGERTPVASGEISSSP